MFMNDHLTTLYMRNPFSDDNCLLNIGLKRHCSYGKEWKWVTESLILDYSGGLLKSEIVLKT